MRAELIAVTNPATFDSTLKSEVRSGTYSKLNVWGIDNVETAVYFDADTLPAQNPETLFTLLTEGKTYGVVGRSDYFNSGVFVYRPSNFTYHELIHRLQMRNCKKDARSPTEQDLLISHFSKSTETVFIDGHFNFRPLHRNSGLSNSTVIVHYIGNPKPWTYMLGKTSSIEEQRVTSVAGGEHRTHLPECSIQLYEREVERFYSVCHDPDPLD